MNIKFNNDTVDISNCKIGTVIQTLWYDESLVVPGKTGNKTGFGHIVGFGKNSTNEILMNVKLMPSFDSNTHVNDEIRSIHPANLNIFI